MSDLIAKAIVARRESKAIDFKRSFNPSFAGDWCELIKDIVAMANSGGGVILIGLDNAGEPSHEDISAVLSLDQACFVDKIHKYTGLQYCDLEVHEVSKRGQAVAALLIHGVSVPMVFQNVGTYEVADRKQKTAFSKGSIYFRHGAKSEPGTTEDIRQVIERQLEAIRREWLDGVRKVIKAPQGSTVSILSGEVKETRDPAATPIRIVDDPAAPGFRLIDHDTTYPYRQRELLLVLKRTLPPGVAVNAYDIQAVRRMHHINDDARFCHRPKFGSMQYSEAFVEWLVDQYNEDAGFFLKARQSDYLRTHL